MKQKYAETAEKMSSSTVFFSQNNGKKQINKFCVRSRTAQTGTNPIHFIKNSDKPIVCTMFNVHAIKIYMHFVTHI